MLEYNKTNVIHTRYEDLDRSKMDSEDIKTFKIGKIDGVIGIEISDGNMNEVIKSIRNGFEHVAKEIGNMQPFFRDKFKFLIEPIDDKRIKLDVRFPKEVINTLPMFLNQMSYSMISIGYLDDRNPKLINKDLYSKYIGEIPKINPILTQATESLKRILIDAMNNIGYSKSDINRLMTAIDEEVGIAKYINKIVILENENSGKWSKKDIETVSMIYGIKLDTFKDEEFDLELPKDSDIMDMIQNMTCNGPSCG